MEKLTPIWFLKHPLDTEQKSYVLLDKLNTYKEFFKKDQITKILNEIFTIIKDLNEFKKEGKITTESYLSLDNEEKQILNYYRRISHESEEYNNLHDVIDRCLDILYRYANIGMGILDEKHNKIKTFEIIPPKGFLDKPNFGFLFIRNLVTDEILPYFWSESDIESADGNKKGILIKKINIEDPLYYSLSYIHVAHELMEIEGTIGPRRTPRILICEIDENFDHRSELVRVAKERFIEKISRETRKKT